MTLRCDISLTFLTGLTYNPRNCYRFPSPNSSYAKIQLFFNTIYTIGASRNPWFEDGFLDFEKH
jgi:hypothetical protein